MTRLSRREFLCRSGQAALGLGIASQLAWPIGCSDGSSFGPSEAAWRQLANSLQGMLLRPGDPTYPKTGLPTNLAFVGIRPQGIVLSAGPPDVQTSVRFAREHGLPAVARSGGHSYAGYSATPGLLIDLSLMDTIKLDPSEGMADIGAGALLDAVDNAVAPIILP